MWKYIENNVLPLLLQHCRWTLPTMPNVVSRATNQYTSMAWNSFSWVTQGKNILIAKYTFLKTIKNATKIWKNMETLALKV